MHFRFLFLPSLLVHLSSFCRRTFAAIFMILLHHTSYTLDTYNMPEQSHVPSNAMGKDVPNEAAFIYTKTIFAAVIIVMICSILTFFSFHIVAFKHKRWLFDTFSECNVDAQYCKGMQPSAT